MLCSWQAKRVVKSRCACELHEQKTQSNHKHYEIKHADVNAADNRIPNWAESAHKGCLMLVDTDDARKDSRRNSWRTQVRFRNGTTFGIRLAHRTHKIVLTFLLTNFPKSHSTESVVS